MGLGKFQEEQSNSIRVAILSLVSLLLAVVLGKRKNIRLAECELFWIPFLPSSPRFSLVTEVVTAWHIASPLGLTPVVVGGKKSSGSSKNPCHQRNHQAPTAHAFHTVC